MRIAIFDYRVVPTNPIGGCHHRMLRGLCAEHDFTVFAPRFENPCPSRIRWVRVPAPLRPLALLFVAFHVLAPLVNLWQRVRHRRGFDLVQMVESNLSFGDVAYSQFCHQAYLQRHWASSRPSGLRGLLRWLDHWLHALAEPRVYRRVRAVIVPSQGLARELAAFYPATADRIRIIPNPVDLDHMRRPRQFDASSTRREIGVAPGDVLLTFVALGQFERKGLPLLLDAVRQLDQPQPSVVVVGGEEDLVRTWRSAVAARGLQSRVRFVGMQRDVRPYLWAADAFVLPSAYETFSLVTFEAAAAGLPIIATPLNGVEEFLRDGENGLLVERSVEGITVGLQRFLRLSAEERRQLGERAQHDVQGYGSQRFVDAWREFYASACGARDR